MEITRRQLRRIIREAINEAEFYDETPEGQLIGTEAEDARFNQQLQAEKVMEQAGLTTGEMSQMWKWIKSGDTDNAFYDSPQFEKLFELLAFDSGVMPYGVAKAKTGEPDLWILEYLDDIASGTQLPQGIAAK